MKTIILKTNDQRTMNRLVSTDRRLALVGGFEQKKNQNFETICVQDQQKIIRVYSCMVRCVFLVLLMTDNMLANCSYLISYNRSWLRL